MTSGAQTIGNIAVYGSVMQLVINFMVLPANPTQFWILTVTGVIFYCDCLHLGKYACQSL